MKKKYLIGVAGNIGVGKTTFTTIVGKHFGWKEIYESVDDNPYLKNFYKDMKRWSFNLQIYFLNHRFSNQIESNNLSRSIIQDRTIYEDVEIFARNLYDMDCMSKRDWLTYKDLFYNMTRFLQKPDLIIYLSASIDTLLSRIKSRNRNFEKDIDPEYLFKLNVSYDRWIKKISNDFNVLKINTDKFNIFKDQDKLDSILEQVSESLEK